MKAILWSLIFCSINLILLGSKSPASDNAPVVRIISENNKGGTAVAPDQFLKWTLTVHSGKIAFVAVDRFNFGLNLPATILSVELGASPKTISGELSGHYFGTAGCRHSSISCGEDQMSFGSVIDMKNKSPIDATLTIELENSKHEILAKIYEERLLPAHRAKILGVNKANIQYLIGGEEFVLIAIGSAGNI